MCLWWVWNGGGVLSWVGLAHCWALRHQDWPHVKWLVDLCVGSGGWWGELVGFVVFVKLIVDASIDSHSWPSWVARTVCLVGWFGWVWFCVGCCFL